MLKLHRASKYLAASATLRLLLESAINEKRNGLAGFDLSSFLGASKDKVVKELRTTVQDYTWKKFRNWWSQMRRRDAKKLQLLLDEAALSAMLPSTRSIPAIAAVPATMWHAPIKTMAAGALNGDTVIAEAQKSEDGSAPTAEPNKKRRRHPPDLCSNAPASVGAAPMNTTENAALNGDAAIEEAQKPGGWSAPTAEPRKKRRRYPPDLYSDDSKLKKEKERFEFDETRIREEVNRLEKEFEKKINESSMQMQRLCGWKNGKKYFKDGTIVYTQKGMSLTEFRKRTDFMVRVNAALSWPSRRERPNLAQIDDLISDQDVNDLRESFFKSDGSLAEDAVSLIDHCRPIAFKNSERDEKDIEDKRYQVHCKEQAFVGN